jgi:hypothetical protein
MALHSKHARRMRNVTVPTVAKTKGAVKKAVARAPGKVAKRPAKPGKTVAAKAAKLPTIALEPKHPTRPSIALPPPPPPPPQRDELIAPRDIGRLLRYGERFGPHKIDVRMLPLQLPVASGALAAFDPGAAKSWRVFDRPVGGGQFRVMLSVARSDDKHGTERLAAVVIHVGRPPIAKWTVAHERGHKKPKSADQLPRVEVASGWIVLLDAGDGAPGPVAVPQAAGIAPVEIPLADGRRALALPCGDGKYAAYWAVDATDKPVCLVVDFDVFTQKDWKSKPT